MQHRFIESRWKAALSVPHKFTLSCLFVCLPVWKPILCKLFSFLCFTLLHRHSQKLRPPYCFYYSSSCSFSLSHPLLLFPLSVFFFFSLLRAVFAPLLFPQTEIRKSRGGSSWAWDAGERNGEWWGDDGEWVANIRGVIQTVTGTIPWLFSFFIGRRSYDSHQ